MRLNDRLDQEAEPLWNGRPGTREQLITLYMSYAEKLASWGSRKNPRVTFEECLSAAHVALIESIDKFRTDSGAKFTSFARWRMVGAIVDVARENDWVPHTARAADKLRDVSNLPVMLTLDEQFDSPTADRERWEADIETLAESIKFDSHRQMVQDVLQLGMDDAVKLSGCTEQQFSGVIKWAMKQVAGRN